MNDSTQADVVVNPALRLRVGKLLALRHDAEQWERVDPQGERRRWGTRGGVTIESAYWYSKLYEIEQRCGGTFALESDTPCWTADELRRWRSELLAEFEIEEARAGLRNMQTWAARERDLARQIDQDLLAPISPHHKTREQRARNVDRLHRDVIRARGRVLHLEAKTSVTSHAAPCARSRNSHGSPPVRRRGSRRSQAQARTPSGDDPGGGEPPGGTDEDHLVLAALPNGGAA